MLFWEISMVVSHQEAHPDPEHCDEYRGLGPAGLCVLLGEQGHRQRHDQAADDRKRFVPAGLGDPLADEQRDNHRGAHHWHQ
jgi:hypothetical protein